MIPYGKILKMVLMSAKDVSRDLNRLHWLTSSTFTMSFMCCSDSRINLADLPTHTLALIQTRCNFLLVVWGSTCTTEIMSFLKFFMQIIFTLQNIYHKAWVNNWSLTSPFSTNMATSETKDQWWRSIPTQWRKASNTLTSTLDTPCPAATQKGKRIKRLI